MAAYNRRALALMFAGGLLTSCQTTQTASNPVNCYEETPLPSDLEITIPTEDVPAELARFSGVWGDGAWDGKLCHTLVVQSIDKYGNVITIYSTGDYASMDAEYNKIPGIIKNGRLVLSTFPNGAETSYWFVGDLLEGSYIRENINSTVTLTKKQ